MNNEQTNRVSRTSQEDATEQQAQAANSQRDAPTAARVSKRGALILRLFLTGKRLYGAEVIKATGLFPGTAYPLLRAFVDYGWLSEEPEVGNPQNLKRPLRTYYRLTATGKAAIVEKLAALEARRAWLVKYQRKLNKILAPIQS